MPKKDVIIALDFPTLEETLAFLDRFPAGEKPFVKIGMEPSAGSRSGATASSSTSSSTTFPTPSSAPWPYCPGWTWTW